MTRIGFLIDYPHYIGGMNYIYNLIYAAKMADEKNEFEFILFVPENVEDTVLDRYKVFSKVIRTRLCERNSVEWLTYKVSFKIFGSTSRMEKFLHEHEIDVLSHSNFYSSNLSVKTIEWLPDFQFTRLPHMFTLFERYRRGRLYKGIINYADRVVVSSHDGAKDYLEFTDGKPSKKLKVLQFVTQPSSDILDLEYSPKLMTKYDIEDEFFYLPNQLWKHKNHLVVIRALRILKGREIKVQVICSGSLDDFRDPNFKSTIFDKIAEYELSDNIKFLGLIPYSDVQYLMRYCLAILNPSLFEGWSSTVEEAKSIGKGMIISDLGVHFEQAPMDSLFFSREDPVELADLIESIIKSKKPGPNHKLESEAKTLLTERTKQFGVNYLDLIKDVVK
ncbi:glycosyltransferase [Colwellia demingiae]|nr:glycosyltransferase [Colwellia demingiae]